MTGPGLVVFDVDGTLVDSQDHILTAMSDAFAAAGHPPPGRQTVLSIVGLSLPEAIARLAPEAPGPVLATILGAYKAGFGAVRARAPAPLYPGARRVLDALRDRPGLTLGIATGNSRRGLDHVLSSHGLARHFATTQVADDHPSKPDPAMLMAALAETGGEAGRAVMIGDTTYDIEMGRAAGFATIGVGWGYHPARALEAAGADSVIDDFAALLPALARLLAPT